MRGKFCMVLRYGAVQSGVTGNAARYLFRLVKVSCHEHAIKPPHSTMWPRLNRHFLCSHVPGTAADTRHVYTVYMVPGIK